jgi:hypothetical protein
VARQKKITSIRGMISMRAFFFGGGGLSFIAVVPCLWLAFEPGY